MNKQIKDIKIKLIAQEHRTWAIFKNLFKFAFRSDKSKSRASILAFIFNFLFSKSTIALTITGLLGYFLTWKSIDIQEQQTKLISQQNSLEEASRKSSIFYLMSEIMNNIALETKLNNNNSNVLSPLLIARIASLSNSLKPYKHLNGDSLSIERGHLLHTLSLSKVDSNSLDKIYKHGNFTFSDLSGLNFSQSYLKNVNLSHSNLNGGNFSYSNMINSTLLKCNVFNTNFYNARLYHSNINSRIDSSLFDSSKIKGVDFHNSEFINSNFDNCDFKGATASNLTIKKSSFRNSSLSKLSLYENQSNKEDLVPQALYAEMKASCDICCVLQEENRSLNLGLDSIIIDSSNNFLKCVYVTSNMRTTTYNNDNSLKMIISKVITKHK